MEEQDRYIPSIEPTKHIEYDKQFLTKEVLLEKDPVKKIAWITFNRPDKLNAFLMSHYAYIGQLMSYLDWDDEVKVIVFRGNGRCFGTGADVGGLGVSRGIDKTGKGPHGRGNQRLRLLNDRGGGVRGRWGVVSPITYSVKTTIAQVHGYCYGAHMFVALAADMMICTEDAKFTHPGYQYLGPTNELGSLFRALPVKIAKEMVLTGRPLTAQEALKYGFANKVVPGDKLEEEVNKLAEAAAALPIDGIVVGKAALEGVLTASGVTMGNYIGHLAHVIQTNLHYEPGEYNLLKERRDKGIHGSHDAREAHYSQARLEAEHRR